MHFSVNMHIANGQRLKFNTVNSQSSESQLGQRSRHQKELVQVLTCGHSRDYRVYESNFPLHMGYWFVVSTRSKFGAHLCSTPIHCLYHTLKCQTFHLMLSLLNYRERERERERASTVVSRIYASLRIQVPLTFSVKVLAQVFSIL